MIQQQLQVIQLGLMYTPIPPVIVPNERPRLKLPHAGVTLGELTGWRCWRLTAHGFLQSGYRDTIWLPGEVQEALPNDLDKGWGIHAFKKEASQQLHAAVDEYSTNGDRQHPFGNGKSLTVAIGTVALWGRVIEHDLGYRAAFAAVQSIEALADVPLADYATRLALLRQQYCPALPDSKSTERCDKLNQQE